MNVLRVRYLYSTLTPLRLYQLGLHGSAVAYLLTCLALALVLVLSSHTCTYVARSISLATTPHYVSSPWVTWAGQKITPWVSFVVFLGHSTEIAQGKIIILIHNSLNINIFEMQAFLFLLSHMPICKEVGSIMEHHLISFVLILGLLNTCALIFGWLIWTDLCYLI